VEGSKVGADEINAVAAASRSMTLPKDRELLDIIDQDYELDNLGGISAPKGMSGRILKLNTLQIHADRNRISDAKTAADTARLEIREPLFSATCAAEAVLEEHEKKNGVLVLDLGGGSTGYTVYSDGYIVTAGVIGVGGDHITNDIAHAFQTTQAQAEALKTHEARAMLGAHDDESARVKIPGSSPLMETRTVSRKALDTVVNARLRELFTVIREQLRDLDLLHRLHSGAVITGGAAAMKDIDALIQRELGMQVRVGRPIHVDGVDEEPFPAAFAAISGALLYAHRNYEEKSILDGLFGRFFK
jgi:cell division protein FtsA